MIIFYIDDPRKFSSNIRIIKRNCGQLVKSKNLDAHLQEGTPISNDIHSPRQTLAHRTPNCTRAVNYIVEIR